jgi:predicted HicB family RNase H-like nuclease
MPRHKTPASDYVPLMLRVPKEVSEELRRQARVSHRVLNTHAILVLQQALGLAPDEEPDVRHPQLVTP